MLWGGHIGGLEIRKRASGAMALHGRFPYNKRAVLSDGGRAGRPKKEVFASRAFAYRVDDPKADIHFLVGHDYDRPLASRAAGTMMLTDSAAALTFDVTITEEIQQVSYARDFLASFAAGLIIGISPGFRTPPKRTVPDAESIADEDPAEGTAIIRTIYNALLYEMSAVTVPAYKDALLEAQGDILADVLTADQLDALKDAKTADAIKVVLAGFRPDQIAAIADAAKSEARSWISEAAPVAPRETLKSGLHRTLSRWRV